MKRSRFSEERIESFNGKFCDECLSQSWHTSLEDARQGIEPWRMDYNTVRPHSSLGYLMPEEYAAITAARPASPLHAGRLRRTGVGANGSSRTP